MGSKPNTVCFIIATICLSFFSCRSTEMTLHPIEVSLFNGTDLSGWHMSRSTHHGTLGNVQVEDGAIVLRQYPLGHGGVLLTDKDFGNFILSFEYKGTPSTNGGLLIRSTESGTAYQLELVGDGERGTGAFFGEMLRTSGSASPPKLDDIWKKGDWNSFRIRVIGEAPVVTFWLNNQKMWEIAMETNDLPGGITKGMIGLQLHWSLTTIPIPGGSCCAYSWTPEGAHYFRNLTIMEL